MFQRLEIRNPRELQGYVVADYADDLDQQRSMMGYVITIAKCVISWNTQLQDTVAPSLTEVEYMAAVEMSKEAL